MELKPGYKQTELGPIPKVWQTISLAELSAFITKGSTPTTYGFKWESGGVLFLRSECVSESGLDLKESMFISQAAHAVLRRSEVRDGDILITITGNVGRAVRLQDVGVANLNQHIARVRPVATDIDSKYVYYYVSQSSVRRRFNSITTGQAYPQISLQQVRDAKVALPPVQEQRAIATALSDVDALIASLDQLIAKKRDIKLATMQQLLTGRQRLPGFRGEWAEKTLGELFEITSSKRVFQSEWRSEGVPFYRARELAVLGETGQVENELFITRELYATHRKSFGVPEIGDMLVTGVGTLGKVYVVSDDREFYFKDGNIIWFRCSGKMSAEFLRQLYLTPVLKKQIEEGAAGTTVGTYTITAAKRTRIPFPTLDEQGAIASVLFDMDAEIAALEQKKKKTRALKQGMMQELLTGRIRLV
ncbi:restriction endonuclease subunit S [Caballeronia sp. INSB1]|uniref:restriction endonuclease subunit S n=1 Tax=Caballeronia sp. INSB1 TaxID=2921751 RepID=UPI002032A489|nr:restriction endonuclease subunit S [Caballeronia sp. INSB1]